MVWSHELHMEYNDAYTLWAWHVAMVPHLLELPCPAPQSVHLDALMVGLGLELRDGLLLLGAVELDLLQGGLHRAKLLLQGWHMLLLLRGRKKKKVDVFFCVCHYRFCAHIHLKKDAEENSTVSRLKAHCPSPTDCYRALLTCSIRFNVY